MAVATCWTDLCSYCSYTDTTHRWGYMYFGLCRYICLTRGQRAKSVDNA